MVRQPPKVLEVIPDTPLTNVVALSAVVSPWWLDLVQTVSDASAIALPIMGVVWLVIQIGLKLYPLFRKKL